jgi:GTPase SAR1 family protein
LGPCRYIDNYLGQDKNTCITKIFCKDAHGCLILSDITNKNSLNEYIQLNFRTIKWKIIIDETSKFVDGSSLPCLLIENKIDLVSEEKATNDIEVLDFAKKNKFIGVYRTSAKQGINISESMGFLIHHIIKKLEANKYNKPDKKKITLGKSDIRKNKCCY